MVRPCTDVATASTSVARTRNCTKVIYALEVWVVSPIAQMGDGWPSLIREAKATKQNVEWANEMCQMKAGSPGQPLSALGSTICGPEYLLAVQSLPSLDCTRRQASTSIQLLLFCCQQRSLAFTVCDFA